jgi:hypothetical protein
MMKRVLFPLFSATVLVGLVSVSVIVFFKQAQEETDLIIAEHIKQLSTIFSRIDATCGIQGFDHQRNSINFLNVISFSGSEVGSMNLIDPKQWEGPYVEDNLMVQNKCYEVIRTKKGYFIVPGEDVILSNGKVIGKDISIDYHSDIPTFIDTKGHLRSENDQPLATAIVTGGKSGNVMLPITHV